MRLSEIPSALAVTVVREAGFSSLGFGTHQRPGMLVFVNDECFLPALLANGSIGAVLTTPALAPRVPAALGLATADEPKDAFYRLHHHLVEHTEFYGRSEPSQLSPSARIHPSAVISESDVQLGDDVEVGARVVVLPGVRVGAGSVLRAGVVLGSEGFQVFRSDGATVRIRHAGRVVIGQRVDIHSNTCVDRSLFGETVVGDDTTIDNLVHVAHDVVIGRRCRIVAHAMIGGSARIGDDAWIGPSVAISSEVTVGAGAYVTLGSVVTRDVEAGSRVTGNFAIDHDRYLAFLRTIR